MSTQTTSRPGARVHVQKFGTFLSNMVMPNIGAFIAWALFDNLSVSTLGQSFTQVVFAFQVSLPLVLY